MLHCDAVCCNVLQCVAVCCSVLQCVVRVLHREAVARMAVWSLEFEV